MGMLMSVMGMGLGRGTPTAQLFNMLTDSLYKQLIQKDVKSFEDFHGTILDMFNIVNSALPGKHYDVPSRTAIKECFKKWEEAPESERENVFVKFMKDEVTISKIDDFTVIAGVITPPAAMAAKKAGENYVPQLRIIKSIPDVIFVPSVTVLALISAKLSRKIIQGKSTFS